MPNSMPKNPVLGKGNWNKSNKKKVNKHFVKVGWSDSKSQKGFVTCSKGEDPLFHSLETNLQMEIDGPDQIISVGKKITYQKGR